jgi:glutamine amidotransferase/cyclase
MSLYLLDYGAGNVASLANSLQKLGHEFTWINSPEDFAKAEVKVYIKPFTSLLNT